MIRLQQVKLPITHTRQDLEKAVEKALHIQPQQMQSYEIVKQSLDARKKSDLRYSYVVDVEIARERQIIKKCKNASLIEKKPYVFPKCGEEKLKYRPVIVGAGPAGLFCALMLARHGYQPLLLERGCDVDTRTRDVEQFWENGILNPRSNVQFGEGGAGTFSDGKLNTLVKDEKGRNRFVLETFVEAGAPKEILYENKPHIGTDILRDVVRHIRKEIQSLGGEVMFETQMTDFEVQNGKISKIRLNGRQWIETEVLVLAIGHSARDTFEMLTKKPLDLHAKSFAVGVRIEHPQKMIDHSQYGEVQEGVLPPAAYKLTEKLDNGRGVYSFCMCPGGYVVNASSEEGRLAVNGMSYHKRDSENANSAIIVTVTPEDFGGDDAMSGVRFQRKLEEAAYRAGSGSIPLQCFEDFCQNKISNALGDVKPQLCGSWKFANVRECFPKVIGDSIEQGIKAFGKRIEGFDRPDALILGVESRTSSPVRIERNKWFESAIKGLYPCGEGAGYAGGITSAAMDGIKVAEAIAEKYEAGNFKIN